MNIRIKGFLPLFFLLAFFGCKKETTNIGVDFLPGGGNINSDAVEIKNIVCRTIAEDSLKTDSLNSNLLGAINDPEFGTTKASLIVQPIISESGDDITGSTIDSITLTLKYDKAQIISGVEHLLKYGDLASTMELEVYRLAEKVTADKKYYSNFNPQLGGLVGSFSGQFNFFDSVEVVVNDDTAMVAPQLTIRLDNAFGQEIIDASALAFNSQDDWLDFLNGLVIVPKTTNLAPGQGCFVGIEAASSQSKLTIHYNGTESREIPMGPLSERIGLYDFSGQTTTITAQKTGTGHYNTTYVQAMGAAKVKLDIEELNAFIEAGEPRAINEAVLSVKVDPSTISEDFPAPYRMVLFKPHSETGGNSAIIDYIDDLIPPSRWSGLTNYGGEYNQETNSYEFHFNRYLQHLVNDFIESGENNFNGFYIAIPSDFPLTPSRTVLNTDTLNGGIKLSVKYTKLN